MRWREWPSSRLRDAPCQFNAPVALPIARQCRLPPLLTRGGCQEPWTRRHRLGINGCIECEAMTRAGLEIDAALQRLIDEAYRLIAALPHAELHAQAEPALRLGHRHRSPRGTGVGPAHRRGRVVEPGWHPSTSRHSVPISRRHHSTRRVFPAHLSGAFIRCVCPVHCRRGMAGPRHMPLQPRLCPSHGANKAAMPRNEKKPTPSVTVVRMIEAAVAGSCPKRRSSTSA